MTRKLNLIADAWMKEHAAEIGFTVHFSISDAENITIIMGPDRNMFAWTFDKAYEAMCSMWPGNDTKKWLVSQRIPEDIAFDYALPQGWVERETMGMSDQERHNFTLRHVWIYDNHPEAGVCGRPFDLWGDSNPVSFPVTTHYSEP